MQLRIFKAGDYWSFAIITSNGVVIAESCRAYASRRNARAAAKLIATSKIKVAEA